MVVLIQFRIFLDLLYHPSLKVGWRQTGGACHWIYFVEWDITWIRNQLSYIRKCGLGLFILITVVMHFIWYRALFIFDISSRSRKWALWTDYWALCNCISIMVQLRLDFLSMACLYFNLLGNVDQTTLRLSSHKPFQNINLLGLILRRWKSGLNLCTRSISTNNWRKTCIMTRWVDTRMYIRCGNCWYLQNLVINI